MFLWDNQLVFYSMDQGWKTNQRWTRFIPVPKCWEKVQWQIIFPVYVPDTMTHHNLGHILLNKILGFQTSLPSRFFGGLFLFVAEAGAGQGAWCQDLCEGKQGWHPWRCSLPASPSSKTSPPRLARARFVTRRQVTLNTPWSWHLDKWVGGTLLRI